MVGLQLRSAALAYRSAADQLQAGHGKSLPENELRDVVFYYPGSFNNLIQYASCKIEEYPVLV